MDRNIVLVVLIQLVLCNAQMYDMSAGNDMVGLVCPCEGGAIGRCTEEDANLYPGGPTTGLVFSTDTASSCIDVPELITITENSKFNMKVHVPYTQSWENMQVFLIEDATAGWFEWFMIPGPIAENERWMEVSMPLPPTITEGTYKVSIWDNASSYKISIRYFEITEEALVTTTVSSTDSSTTSTTVTTTASSTITTTASITDSSTASITDSSTASITDSSTASITDSSTASITDSSTASITDSSTASITDSSTAPSTTVSTIDTTTKFSIESTTVSITHEPTKTSDYTNVPQTTTDPPPRGSKISVWGVILGIVIGVTAMCLLISCWFIAAGWRRRRRDNKPDDMVSLPRLEVIHTSDSSTNSSTIGITGKRRTDNWVFR